jgi:hypothetical protein
MAREGLSILYISAALKDPGPLNSKNVLKLLNNSSRDVTESRRVRRPKGNLSQHFKTLIFLLPILLA